VASVQKNCNFSSSNNPTCVGYCFWYDYEYGRDWLRPPLSRGRANFPDFSIALADVTMTVCPDIVVPRFSVAIFK